MAGLALLVSCGACCQSPLLVRVLWIRKNPPNLRRGHLFGCRPVSKTKARQRHSMQLLLPYFPCAVCCIVLEGAQFQKDRAGGGWDIFSLGFRTRILLDRLDRAFYVCIRLFSPPKNTKCGPHKTAYFVEQRQSLLSTQNAPALRRDREARSRISFKRTNN